MENLRLSRFPQKLSHIQSIKGHEYILILWKYRGYEAEKYYSVHLVDTKANLIAPEPYMEIYTPYEQRNRYAPYFHNFMALVIYAVSMELFKKTKIRLTIEQLDKIYGKFLNDYNSGIFDSYSIAAPELGRIIKGRIK